MKWLSFLVVTFSVALLLIPAVALSEPDKPVVIQSISHTSDSETKETIIFKLAASVIPKIFIIRGEKPRLVIDFPESIYWGKNIIPLSEGVLSSAIRIGMHETPVKRTRVVLDLSKEVEVQYSSEYQQQENTLVVVLTADSPVPPQSTPKPEQPKPEQAKPELPKPSPVVLPSPEKLSVKPLDDKPVTPAPIMPSKAMEEKSPAVKKIEPALPTILEISFDDSSNRGEMAVFHLNDFSPPTVSAIEKDSPRVLCDFNEMDLGPNVQRTILAQGKYIQRIRTAIHQDPDKVRVVLDLSPNRDYELQQVYFRNDNLFVLIVNETKPEQDTVQ